RFAEIVDGGLPWLKCVALAREVLSTAPAMILPDVVAKTRTLGRTLSGLASLGIGDRTVYDGVLRCTIEAAPEVYGAWTVWEPGALDGQDRHFRNKPGHDATGRFVPFWFKSGGSIRREPSTNYECPGIGDYYLGPRETQVERTIRLAPYIDCAGEKHIFTCHIVPIIRGDRFLGVVGIDVLPQKIEADARHHSQALTPREHEVLKWIAAGKTNSEIGTILGISSHTAKHHVAKVLAKMGLENRQAATCAYLSDDFARKL
ncbi:MAG: LuxR family transcriptional regulator, partial [Verrucomicrobia bacterium]